MLDEQADPAVRAVAPGGDAVTRNERGSTIRSTPVSAAGSDPIPSGDGAASTMIMPVTPVLVSGPSVGALTATRDARWSSEPSADARPAHVRGAVAEVPAPGPRPRRRLVLSALDRRARLRPALPVHPAADQPVAEVPQHGVCGSPPTCSARSVRHTLEVRLGVTILVLFVLSSVARDRADLRPEPGGGQAPRPTSPSACSAATCGRRTPSTSSRNSSRAGAQRAERGRRHPPAGADVDADHRRQHGAGALIIAVVMLVITPVVTAVAVALLRVRQPPVHARW